MDEKSLYGRYLQHKKYGKYFFDYVPEKSRPNIDSGDSHSLNNKFSQPNVLNLDFERPDVKNVDEFRRFPNGLYFIFVFRKHLESISNQCFSQMIRWKICEMLISRSRSSLMKSCGRRIEMRTLRRLNRSTIELQANQLAVIVCDEYYVSNQNQQKKQKTGSPFSVMNELASSVVAVDRKYLQ